MLEIGVGKIGLDEFGLFFQHGGHDADDVVVEGDLSDLPVTIADGIDEIQAGGNACRQLLDLSLHLVAILPGDVTVCIVEIPDDIRQHIHLR